MKGWLGTLLFALLLGDGLAQTMDTVFLAGQAPIVGKLKRIRYGTLHFKGENLGNLEIDLTHVHTIRAYGYGYRIQTAQRQFVVGVFIPHKDPGKVTVYDGFQNQDFEVRNLNEVQLIHQSFFRRMEGRAGAGYSFSRSSEIGRWNGDFVLEYDTERLDVDLRGSVILTQEEGQLSRERESLQLLGNYYLDPTWYSFGLVNYQRNLQLGISRRLQQGLGMGVHLIQHKRGITRLRTGAVINQEFNLEGTRNNSLYEWPIMLDVTLFKLRNPKIRFNTTQTIFVGLTQSGRYRNDGDTRLSWTVVNNLDIGLNFYNNYDNQPPVEMGENFDYGMVIHIGYTF